MTTASVGRYSFEEALAASERIQWRVEDLIGGDKQLDFRKPFLPESLVRAEQLGFLTPWERLALNHIRAHAYLAHFGLAEEFILPFVLDHARPQLGGDDYQVRALLQFAGEEAKHIHLFRRFREEFQEYFGTVCLVIGPPSSIARVVLSHDPLAVALTTLQIEWMTQRHYVESARDDRGLDPQFKSLLLHHWLEEAQHTKLDTLIVEALAASRTREQIADAVEEYLEIVDFFDQGLALQAALDRESLEQATGRELTPDERQRLEEVQHQAYRWTFIGSGMTHPNVLATFGHLSPEARKRVEAVSRTYC